MISLNLAKTSLIGCLASLGLTLALSSTNCKGAIPGYPNSIYEFDAREIAMLPNYCIHTQHFREKVPGGNNRLEIERWNFLMGETYHHMHHYCYALINNNRALILARNNYDRRFYLNETIREIDYVIDRAPSTFALLPEMFTKKGDSLLRLGKEVQGLNILHRAIELKPDYWPPYALISDFYKNKGDEQKSREYLDSGLSHSPDATALKQRVKELETAKNHRSLLPQIK